MIKLSRGRSVGLLVPPCVVRPVHCRKTADWIRMPFGIICRTGPGMGRYSGVGDRSTGRGTFGVQFGARHCNQWGLYGVRVRQCHDAALLPNYFRQTCYELMIITNCGLSGQRCSRHTLFPLYFSICFCLSRVANLLWTMSAHQ